jgi:hypothetical protein
MKKSKIIFAVKLALFSTTSIIMWALLYVQFNSFDGILVHSFVSGAVLVVPVLILNFIFSQIFLQTMRTQNRAMLKTATGE